MFSIAPRALHYTQCVVAVGLIGIIIAWNAVNTLPKGPATAALHGKLLLASYSFSPQGWAFFTRNPREPNFEVYRLDAKGEPERAWRNGFEWQTAFGINRLSRRVGAEIEELFQQVYEPLLVSCDELSTRDCFAKAGSQPSVSVRNSTAFPMVCGDVILRKVDRVPQAWLGLKDYRPPAQLVRVNVECTRL